MYPAQFFGLFPPFPRNSQVFVAMSFDSSFDRRWTDVLMPAIQAVEFEGNQLIPHRVDLRRVSNSILTEILEGIANCRLVVADVTATGEHSGRPIRNENVFYEVGLAHAFRQAEEVLLLRSDNSPLPFDIANVRIHRYDPDSDVQAARTFVTTTIRESLREIEANRNLSVKLTAKRLCPHEMMVLLDAMQRGVLPYPSSRTTGDILGGSDRKDAIRELSRIGALEAQYVQLTSEMVPILNRSPEQMISYVVSPFGRALYQYCINQMRIT